MIDDHIYSVTCINGYRRACLTLEQAAGMVARLNAQMRRNGWTGRARMFYRDGTEVDSSGAPVRRKADVA